MNTMTPVHEFDVASIAQEAQLLPLEAWQETKTWSNPKNLAASNIGDYSKKAGMSVIQEQDRTLLMWHKSPDQRPWWEHTGYRQFDTVPTQWAEHCSGTMQILSEYFAQQGKQLVRLYFSKLQPGRQIHPHTDQSFWHDRFDKIIRYGLCVTTNDQCVLTCANDEWHVPAGTLYWMDSYNHVHSAVNFGTTDRIHMYMDVI